MPEEKEHFHIHLPHHHEQHPPLLSNTTWEVVQLARHPQRPHSLDYFKGPHRILSDFVELHGDRVYGDDPAIVGGVGVFEGQTVMVIGHQKGHTTKANIACNFGMPKAEGFRKAERLMKQAARFDYPILTFLDTQGADPSKESEERGIAQAIAKNLAVMQSIEVPIIVTVIGEGGSGGALGIGIGDRVLMLANSIFTVASPEPAAAILWHDAKQAAAAAEAMRITAQDNLNFGFAAEIIPEPEGGAHMNHSATIKAVREAISRHLTEIQTTYDLRSEKGKRHLVVDRRQRYKNMGAFTDIPPNNNST